MTVNESFNTTDSATLGPDQAWIEPVGQYNIVSNAAQSVNPNQNNLALTAALSKDDQYAEVVVPALPGSNQTAGGPVVRGDDTGETYYYAQINTDGVARIYKRTAALLHETTVNPAPTAPYTLRLEASGASLSLQLDGVEIASATDSDISGADQRRPGMYAYQSDASAVRYDSFEAGELAPDPIIPGTTSWTGTTNPTATPAQVGTAGKGFNSQCFGRWDVVERQLVPSGGMKIGLLAFHINGIDKVEVAANGGAWIEATEWTRDATTGYWRYWFTVEPGTLTDGDEIVLRARLYPKTRGLCRVMQDDSQDTTRTRTGAGNLTLFANGGGSLSDDEGTLYCSASATYGAGDGSLGNPFRHPNEAFEKLRTDFSSDVTQANGWRVVCLTRGVYNVHRSWGFQITNVTRWVTVTKAAGLAREDVRLGCLSLTSRGADSFPAQTSGTLTGVSGATVSDSSLNIDPAGLQTMVILMTSGPDEGQYRRITAWDNTTKTMTLDVGFANAASGDAYEIHFDARHPLLSSRMVYPRYKDITIDLGLIGQHTQRAWFDNCLLVENSGGWLSDSNLPRHITVHSKLEDAADITNIAGTVITTSLIGGTDRTGKVMIAAGEARLIKSHNTANGEIEVYFAFSSLTTSDTFDVHDYTNADSTKMYHTVFRQSRSTSLYFTDCDAVSVHNAFTSASIVRNCLSEKVSGDTHRQCGLVVDNRFREIDGSVSGQHTDTGQYFGEPATDMGRPAPQDVIVMNNRDLGGSVDPQVFFLGHNSTTGPYKNFAWVNNAWTFASTDSTAGQFQFDQTNESVPGDGGTAASSHVIFWHNTMRTWFFFRTNNVFAGTDCEVYASVAKYLIAKTGGTFLTEVNVDENHWFETGVFEQYAGTNSTSGAESAVFDNPTGGSFLPIGDLLARVTPKVPFDANNAARQPTTAIGAYEAS